jgi:AraC family transcriptional regulator
MRTEHPSAGDSATRTCSNSLPPALLSSRTLGWHGIVVELRCSSNLDVVLPYPDHVVAVILAGKAILWQSRGDRIAQRVVGPGDVVVTPAGEPKRWQHVDDLLALVMRLSRDYLDELAGELDLRHREGVAIKHVLSARDRFAYRMAMTFLRALEPQSGATRAQIDTLVRSLGLHLLTTYAVRRARSTSRLPAMPAKKLRQAVDYIEANLHRDLSVANVARHVTMSESHFSHAFQKTLGLSPHRYVRERRIERAKALLRESDMPLGEIAQRVGCSSSSSFSVLFHSATGTTPSTYKSSC